MKNLHLKYTPNKAAVYIDTALNQFKSICPNNWPENHADFISGDEDQTIDGITGWIVMKNTGLVVPVETYCPRRNEWPDELAKIPFKGPLVPVSCSEIESRFPKIWSVTKNDQLITVVVSEFTTVEEMVKAPHCTEVMSDVAEFVNVHGGISRFKIEVTWYGGSRGLPNGIKYPALRWALKCIESEYGYKKTEDELSHPSGAPAFYNKIVGWWTMCLSTGLPKALGRDDPLANYLATGIRPLWLPVHQGVIKITDGWVLVSNQDKSVVIEIRNDEQVSAYVPCTMREFAVKEEFFANPEKYIGKLKANFVPVKHPLKPVLND